MLKREYYKLLYFLSLQFYLLFFCNVKCIKEPFNEKINVKVIEYPKILCAIFSHPKKETSTLNHIIRTWLTHCDKALFITTTGENFHDKGEEKKMMRIEVIKILSNGEKMSIFTETIKSFMILYNKFFNNTIGQKYDWLLKVNDNSFVVIENLKRFLRNKDKNESIYYGYNSNFNEKDNKILLNRKYITGGSGKEIFNGFEDVIIGRCFEKLGIKGGNSKDENGLETFLPPINKKKYTLKLSKFEEMYNVFPGDKNECQKMSQYPISFHNIIPENLYILNYIFYNGKVYINKYD